MTRHCRLRSATCLGLFPLLPLAPARAEDKPPAADRPAKAADDVQGRIDALLREMTLEEKLGQFSQQLGGEVGDTNPDTGKKKQEEILALARSGKAGSFLNRPVVVRPRTGAKARKRYGRGRSASRRRACGRGA
jgi:hypothetical protein